MHELARGIALVALISGATSCNKGPAVAPPPAQSQALGSAEPAAPKAGAHASPAAMAEAKELFGSRCMPCHGAGGAGDGPASAGLTPKPRNFTDAEWQSKVTDEHIEKIIQYGGAAVGKSPAMPPNPDLMSKAETVAALREHIRSLKK